MLYMLMQASAMLGVVQVMDIVGPKGLLHYPAENPEFADEYMIFTAGAGEEEECLLQSIRLFILPRILQSFDQATDSSDQLRRDGALCCA